MVPLSSLLFGRPSKPPPPFLDSQKWQSLPLAKIEQETHNVKRLTFALPHKLQLLGLPAGMCVKLKVSLNGKKDIEQAFNPISTDDTPGEMTILVKSYPGRHGMGPAHPEHEVGVALHSLQVGQTVQVKGPFGSFRYQPGKYKAIGLLAGGTGVTAMFNLAHVILKNPNDKVKLRLVYASNGMDDILLKLPLDAMAAGYYGKFKALFVVNEAPDEGHHVSMGLIDKEMITKYVNAPPSEDVLMVVCGPRAFVADQAANLEELGYKNVVVIDDLPQITEGAAYMNTQGDHRFD
ncbi:hypothetical protein CVIRNUC_011033 [Coccomyxa viridis]|uniref:FAD-binding FR-type domain-containing protein n=1 Tax=Coccomyxa viridis TaxID=1274662 RepID=A0AAV1ILW9_9CHLO|nr:hypothetical protein CVIRNUC_011033 [Coccomyxa viridis]